MLALGVAISALFAALRRDRRDALGLLALLLALRCALDYWNVGYYALPLLMALLAWEASHGRTPFATVAVTAALWGTFEAAPGHLSPDHETLLYMVWMSGLMAALTVRLFAPARFASLRSAIETRMKIALPNLIGKTAPRLTS